jgi:hypothetical protein
MASTNARGGNRKAVGRLNKFVCQQPPADGILPFVHITRAYRFDQILDENQLRPSYCDFFKKKLTYLFYGRPAYRAKDGNNARLEFEWPIILVFDPHKLGALDRVYPFDTGAFELKVYQDFFDKDSQISDFELTPSLDVIRSFVGTFYLNHGEYYQGRSRRNVDIPPRQFEAQGILEMSRIPGVQGTRSRAGIRDERSSALEAQTRHSIKLSNALLALIIPEPYLDDNDVKNALERWNVAKIKTYQTLHNMGGEVWVGQIYQLVSELYEELGFLPSSKARK